MGISGMTAHDYNRQNALEVPLEALKRFLKLNHWRLKTRTAGDLLVYGGNNDDHGHPITLVLPITSEFDDASQMVMKALNLLGAIQHKSVQALSDEINNLGCDFLRQRVGTPSNSPTLPLKTANEVLKNLSDLIEYAACLEFDPQPFYSRRRAVGKDYLEKCHFGQTFVGSFGMSLQMPIPLSTDESPEEVPFERRIMTRIARGLSLIEKGLREADVSILTDGYLTGFNANLLETMAEMGRTLQNNKMEFSFSWSPEFLQPPDIQVVRSLRFSADSLVPFVQSAAKSLRSSSESKDTIVKGRIIQLRSESSGDEEMTETVLSDSDRGMITITWEMEQGKSVLIRVPLSLENYRLSCDAHKNESVVSVRGRPEKRGKFFYLTSPSEFKVIDPNDL